MHENRGYRAASSITKSTCEYAVVIPTYDRPGTLDYLVQAVDSVLGQTLPAAELIVVCDGPAAAAHDALAGRPVKILDAPPGSRGRARNTGLAASHSEWICFLDDDDLWHPDFLQETDHFLSAHPGAAAVNASYWTFAAANQYGADLVASDLAECLSAAGGASGGCDTSYLQIHGRSFDLLLERNRANVSGAAVRRDIVDRAGGFPVDIQCGEDWLFSVNVARFVEWNYLPERLVFRRLHPTNTTRTMATNGVDALQAIHQMWGEKSLPTPAHRPLAAYGRDYRFRVQETLWGALHNRRFDLARRALSMGLPLLPNWRDRIYACTPRQLTWRAERIIAGVKSRPWAAGAARRS